MIFPDIKIESLEMGTYQPSRTQITHSGKRFSQTSNIQRWTFKASYSLLNQTDCARLWAAIVAAKGRHEVFTFLPPIYSNSHGDVWGIATTNTTEIGSVFVNFLGTQGSLAMGDYIKFSNHDKVYLVLDAANGFVKIEPPLYQPVNPDVTLIYTNVSFRMSLESDKSALNIKPPALGSVSISLIEVVT